MLADNFTHELPETPKNSRRMISSQSAQEVGIKRILLILIVILGLGSSIHAQGFSIGAGLGFSNAGGDGGLGISVPFEIGLANFGDIGLSVRVEVGLVFSQKPDLNLVFSPLVTYTISSLDFLPITVYAGPTLRLFVQNVFEDARTSTWSFLGGLAGASVSVFGVVSAFAETNLSVLAGVPVFGFQVGLRL
jgi:hypothetical protein